MLGEPVSQDIQASRFRVMSDDWSLLHRIVFLLFNLTTLIGVVSFLAFDVSLLDGIFDDPSSDSRGWVLVLVFASAVSMQSGWAWIVWQVYHSQNVIRAAVIAIVPLLLTSLPLGAMAYAEMTREPPPPVPVVY
jgi:hypothetical protein